MSSLAGHSPSALVDAPSYRAMGGCVTSCMTTHTLSRNIQYPGPLVPVHVLLICNREARWASPLDHAPTELGLAARYTAWTAHIVRLQGASKSAEMDALSSLTQVPQPLHGPCAVLPFLLRVCSRTPSRDVRPSAAFLLPAAPSRKAVLGLTCSARCLEHTPEQATYSTCTILISGGFP